MIALSLRFSSMGYLWLVTLTLGLKTLICDTKVTFSELKVN